MAPNILIFNTLIAALDKARCHSQPAADDRQCLTKRSTCYMCICLTRILATAPFVALSLTKERLLIRFGKVAVQAVSWF